MFIFIFLCTPHRFLLLSIFLSKTNNKKVLSTITVRNTSLLTLNKLFFLKLSRHYVFPSEKPFITLNFTKVILRKNMEGHPFRKVVFFDIQYYSMSNRFVKTLFFFGYLHGLHYHLVVIIYKHYF